jgi:DNA helicase-4
MDSEITLLIDRLIVAMRSNVGTERQLRQELQWRLSRTDWLRLDELIEARRQKEPLILQPDDLAAVHLERELIQRLSSRKKRHEKRRKWVHDERARRSQAELDRRRAVVVQVVERALEKSFLEAEREWTATPDANLLSYKEFDDIRTEFVQRWAEKHLDLSLDGDQARAVGAWGAQVLVTARAGSGKTRALVARAAFLQKHLGVPAQHILLLAFNKKAAQEMRSRLTNWLPDTLPHVMTFHAFAYALVRPHRKLIGDDGSGGMLFQSREVQDLLDQHLQARRYLILIKDLMLRLFTEDWESLHRRGADLPAEELLRLRRSAPRETLKGEIVRSHGERVIANTLFENDVRYRYEPLVSLNDQPYRPDFVIPHSKGGLVIEYLGLTGDKAYDATSDVKRAYWAQRKHYTLLEVLPKDLPRLGEGRHCAKVLEALDKVGISRCVLDEKEIWERIKHRAIDKFTTTMKHFIGRCRTAGWSPKVLSERIKAHVAITKAERRFLRLARAIYSAYVKMLDKKQLEDFPGLMRQALEKLETGQTIFVQNHGLTRADAASLQHVLVDEFQDCTASFCEMLQGLRAVANGLRVFCVGDDWQAVNGFAGADTKYFRDFASYFGAPNAVAITTNYRSAECVVRVGNGVMQGRGVPGRSGVSVRGAVRIAEVDRLEPSPDERGVYPKNEYMPAVTRLAADARRRGMRVALLGRRNAIEWAPEARKGEVPASGAGLARLEKHLRAIAVSDGEGWIECTTVHKFKGLERDCVIILDAVDRQFPMLHATWAFLRIFGVTVETLLEDERRLFYVAATRAVNELVVCTESDKASEFILECSELRGAERVDWAKMPPVARDNEYVEVCVLGGFDVRHELKAAGFRWAPMRKVWTKLVQASAFDSASVLQEKWCRDGVKVLVRGGDGAVIMQS